MFENPAADIIAACRNLNRVAGRAYAAIGSVREDIAHEHDNARGVTADRLAALLATIDATLEQLQTCEADAEALPDLPRD